MSFYRDSLRILRFQPFKIGNNLNNFNKKNIHIFHRIPDLQIFALYKPFLSKEVPNVCLNNAGITIRFSEAYGVRFFQIMKFL